MGQDESEGGGPMAGEARRLAQYERKVRKAEADNLLRRDRPAAVLDVAGANRFISHSMPELTPEQKRRLAAATAELHAVDAQKKAAAGRKAAAAMAKLNAANALAASGKKVAAGGKAEVANGNPVLLSPKHATTPEESPADTTTSSKRPRRSERGATAAGGRPTADTFF
uniref:Uncharacterized protein n=1 Tax=Chlamydomonas euryale TaxID=1486919 RepID=A0A6U2J8D4_9CHLO